MKNRFSILVFLKFGILVFVCVCGLSLRALATSAFSPWDPDSRDGVESLVYASSSTVDVSRVLGPPDDIVRSEQMFPVIENYYYYDKQKSGAATVFVFQNGLLMGMQYKSPNNQFVDLTCFLNNNHDTAINWPLNGGYTLYAPNFPFYQWR